MLMCSALTVFNTTKREDDCKGLEKLELFGHLEDVPLSVQALLKAAPRKFSAPLQLLIPVTALRNQTHQI